MINRVLKEAQVINKYSKDEYGQRHSSLASSHTISITFGLYEHNMSNDIRYADCKYVGLTKDTTLTDNDYLLIDGKEYKVQFINPFGRWVQVFMK